MSYQQDYSSAKELIKPDNHPDLLRENDLQNPYASWPMPSATYTYYIWTDQEVSPSEVALEAKFVNSNLPSMDSAIGFEVQIENVMSFYDEILNLQVSRTQSSPADNSSDPSA